MRTRLTPLQHLVTLPLDRFVPAAFERLRLATLGELVALVGTAPAARPSVEQLAAMIITLDAGGSKLAAVERAVVVEAVAATAGNVSAAARLLGMERKTLERRLLRARMAR
jgi:transcriptional regulator of acetoin/glycerol metabolism